MSFTEDIAGKTFNVISNEVRVRNLFAMRFLGTNLEKTKLDSKQRLSLEDAALFDKHNILKERLLRNKPFHPLSPMESIFPAMERVFRPVERVFRRLESFFRMMEYVFRMTDC